MGQSEGGKLSLILFLVEINGILGELRNGVDGLLFADNLTIYTTIRSLRMATRAL